jgi:hypothetical protein
MAATVAIRADMRGFQRRKSPLLRDRAAPLVNVRHQHAERSLSEPWSDEMRLAKARRWFGYARNLGLGQTVADGLP